MAPPFPLFLEPNEGTPEDKSQQVADGREESGGGGGNLGALWWEFLSSPILEAFSSEFLLGKTIHLII